MKITHLFFGLFLPFCLHAQQVTVSIDWYRNSDSLYTFKGAQYVHPFEQTPWLSTKIRIPEGFSVKDVHIDSVSGRTVEDEHLGYATPAFNARVNLFTAGDSRYLLVEGYPFLNNKSETKLVTRIHLALMSEQQHKAELKANASPVIIKNKAVLKTGNWFKAGINKTGVYKISYSDLENLGFGNPADIRVFGNGGSMLPVNNASLPSGGLNEIPVYINKGNDNVFNSGDYLLFYAEGPVKYQYDTAALSIRQKIHYYSTTAYVFLTTSLGEGRQIQAVDLNTQNATYQTSSYNNIYYYEHENYNLIHSGNKWFSYKFNSSNTFDTSFVIPNRITGEPVQVLCEMAGQSQAGGSFSVKVNDVVQGWASFEGTNFSSSTSNFATSAVFNKSLSSTQKDVHVNITFNKTNLQDKAWVDFITLNTRNSLTFNQNELRFRDFRSLGNDFTNYQVNTAGKGIIIWNVSDINKVYSLVTSGSGNTISFTDSSAQLQEYIALDYSGDFPIPDFNAENEHIGWIENQSISDAEPVEFIIVAHPLFMAYAQEVAALHAVEDNLSVMVVDVREIYNDYSSGMRDAGAIRAFVRDMYNKSLSVPEPLKYLLLFGDGSFNNFSEHERNNNFIPTFQASNSLKPTASYVTDDFYGLLNDNETGVKGLLDIGIGRFPVKDTLEARIVVDKLKAYYQGIISNRWNNNITFIADDDEDGDSGHMSDAENISEIVSETRPEMHIDKIYIDAYQQVTSAQGSRYPDANIAIDNALLKGQYIVNYSGHGGEEGMAHERIVTREQVRDWKNKDRYPIFVTATCELSAYDLIDPDFLSDRTTTGEEIFLLEDGGAIAMFTTTRVVFKSANLALNRAFYNNLFKQKSNGDYYCIGDIIKNAKNELNLSNNSLNFTLLGDPAIRLGFSSSKVVVDSLNHQPVNQYMSDTVSALDSVFISGYIEDFHGNMVSDFNGINYISFFDKEQQLKTLNNDGQGSFPFILRNTLLYRGRATVQNGRFKAGFILPKDISYNIGNGRITFFATDSVRNASGAFDSIIVGGVSEITGTDVQGPEIDIYLNDTTFTDGSITSANPVLQVLLYDKNGLNVSGAGIGHDMIAYLDGDFSHVYVLNDYYQAMPDDFTRGQINYQLTGLNSGKHTLTVQVWDVYNNVSENSIEFTVSSEKNIAINKIINYPNPFKQNTYFMFEHNMPDEQLKATIKVYQVNGQLVDGFTTEVKSNGIVSIPVRYNAASLDPGVYVYTIGVETINGYQSTKHGKLIKTD